MSSAPFHNPHMSQPWLLPNRGRLETVGSANSQDSFISQVPLPYHLPANPPHPPHLSQPLTSTMEQGWAHQVCPDQPSMAFGNSPINPVESFAVSQYRVEPTQDIPAMSTSFGGYYDQHQPAPGAYGSQYDSYHNTYHRTQSPFGNRHYPSESTVYPQFGVHAYPQNDWQNGYSLSQIDPHYQHGGRLNNQSAGGIYSQDRMLSSSDFDRSNAASPANYPTTYGNNEENRSYHMGKIPHRRNTHGGPRSLAGSHSSRGQSNYSGRHPNCNRGPRRHVSAGGDRSGRQHCGGRPVSYFDTNPDEAREQFKPSSHNSSPNKPIGYGRSVPAPDSPESMPPKTSIQQTPTAQVVEVRPTPKTARELGQNTPTPFLRSRRNESVVSAAKTFRADPAKAPPPTFWPEGKQESSPESAEVSPRTVAKAKVLSVHDAQDPFITGPLDARMGSNVAIAVKSSHFDARTPSRPVAPLIISHQHPISGPSPHLMALCPGGQKPTIDVAFNTANIPFVEAARTHPAKCSTGLVRISNIPFSCTSQEILAFLGRNAKLIPEVEEPVHIVMERVTSKTMDAYVEFININEAVNAVTRYETNRASGRSGRLGERHVNLEVCGHELFMQALFPKAVNVQWNGIDPQILNKQDSYNSGFKGFVSREELVMLVKHVEAPQRSPFSKECPQRPFECLISTVIKYPWHRVEDITLGDRDALFDAAIALCKNLVEYVDSGSQDLSVNAKLLKRVQRAVLNCDGFNESQKDDFAFLFKMTSVDAGLPPHADHWIVFKTISAKRGWAPDVIFYYIALLREATTSSALVSLAEQSAKGQPTGPLSAFGNIKIEYPPDVSHMSLAAAGEIEWHVIEALLRKVLPQ